ncbi:MAG: hypothetical protein IJM27_07915 [Eubacterium sp.]|nr:hypothetical protein [Eubacterium sp.]
MQTSVELQDPMSYYLFWLILAIIAVAAVFFIQIFFRILLRDQLKRKREKELKVKPPKKKPLSVLKWEYLQRLDRLERGIAAGSYTKRNAYQELSMLIRTFVTDATGIKVQNYSLQEIRRVGIPGLTALVQEYYEPEFARQSMADIRASLFRTRKAIELWS